MQVEIKRLNPAASLPEYKTDGAAGVDLVADIDHREMIWPGGVAKIGSGVAVSTPAGYCGLVVPRSGLGSKGLVLGNGTGIIDSDYTGEIILALLNRNEPEFGPIEIQPGQRVAQLLIMPVIQAQFVAVDEFTRKTGRGAGGFGSTGE